MASGNSSSFHQARNLDPSQIAKLQILKGCLPEIEEELCVSILMGLDWDVIAAVEELGGSTLPTNEWPTPHEVNFSSASAIHSSSSSSSPSFEENGLQNLCIDKKCSTRGFRNQATSSRDTSQGHAAVVKSNGLTSGSDGSISIPKPQMQPKLPAFKNLLPGMNPEFFKDIYQQELNFGYNREVIKQLTASDENSSKRLLIIMRGVPGSGKSTLAKLFVSLCGSAKIFSADDYFLNSNGVYKFRADELKQAHDTCQANCLQVLKQGAGPVVVDNTNTQTWEMLPYAIMALDYGYTLHIAEPSTHWKHNPAMLAKKNSHDVPADKIRIMLKRFENNITVKGLVNSARQEKQKSEKGKRSTSVPARSVAPQRARSISGKGSESVPQSVCSDDKDKHRCASASSDTRNSPEVENNLVQMRTSSEGSSTGFNGSTLSPDTDLLEPIDGEDWVDLPLVPTFLADITKLYCPEEQPVDTTNIRIPPSLAFELFRYIQLNEIYKKSLSSLGPHDSDKKEADSSAQMRIRKLQSAFPNVSEDEIKIICSSTNGNFDDAFHVLQMQYGENINSKTRNVNFPIIQLKRSTTPALVQVKGKHDKVVEPAGDVGVGFDDKVEETWPAARWRQEGYFYGDRMDEIKARMNSTQKNCVGYGGIMEHLRAQLNEYKYQKEYCHRKAQELILPASFYDKEHPPYQLDLHWLHVDESISIVQIFLHRHKEYIRRSGIDKKVVLNIIPGQGKNSAVGPKILPAVARFLKSHHYDHHINPSKFSITVTLTPESKKTIKRP